MKSGNSGRTSSNEVDPLNQAALVIGGGIAGVQASLDLADQGFEVYLVERNPSIGGKMIQLDKTFPTMDCSACILTPKMVDASKHSKIHLLTYSEVNKVEGKQGAFKVSITRKPRYVDETTCTGCGLCATRCPVEVPSEFDDGLGVRRAIYVPFPQAVPLVYTIDMDNCILCSVCERTCAAHAIKFDDTNKQLEIDVGAIILATGYKMFSTEKRPEYGHGKYDNVVTGLTIERLLSASGPTGGHVVRPSDGKIPKKIAFIQCVGSRDQSIGNSYCSRVCCMYALKQARLLKEHVPDADITIFYMDIRAFGKGYEEFYRRACEDLKLRLVRGRVAKVDEDLNTRDLTVKVEDTEQGKVRTENFQMLVLSAGLESTSNEITSLMPIALGEDRFFQSVDPKLNPVLTSVEGVFVAGVAEGPKDIPDSVTQASAAAMKASIILGKGRK
jgi:heterodisulfide reductase subunit A